MTLLTLIPSKDGYSVRDASVAYTAPLKGGLGRTRQDLLGGSSSVSVVWKLNKVQYEQLRAFYLETTARGSETFQLQLVMDEPGLTQHDVNFVPGSLSLDSLNGGTYVVTAELEVVPLAADAGLDNSIMDVFEATGGAEESELLLNLLAELVNVKLPAALS